MQPTVTYDIEVAGLMDKVWEDWLEAPRIRCTDEDGRPVTCLTVQFQDQAGLIGLLRQLHGMGLELLSVTRLEKPPAHTGTPTRA